MSLLRMFADAAAQASNGNKKYLELEPIHSKYHTLLYVGAKLSNLAYEAGEKDKPSLEKRIGADGAACGLCAELLHEGRDFFLIRAQALSLIDRSDCHPVFAIAIRGSAEINDWRDSIDVTGGDDFHPGFLRRAEEIRDTLLKLKIGRPKFQKFDDRAVGHDIRDPIAKAIKECAENIVCREPTTCLFGHSLGGAIAHVLVNLLPDQFTQGRRVQVCSFGAPCVNRRIPRVEDLEDALRINVIRGHDPVPRLLGLPEIGPLKTLMSTYLRAQSDGPVKIALRRFLHLAECTHTYTYRPDTKLFFIGEDKVVRIVDASKREWALDVSAIYNAWLQGRNAVEDHFVDGYLECAQHALLEIQRAKDIATVVTAGHVMRGRLGSRSTPY